MRKLLISFMFFVALALPCTSWAEPFLYSAWVPWDEPGAKIAGVEVLWRSHYKKGFYPLGACYRGRCLETHTEKGQRLKLDLARLYIRPGFEYLFSVRFKGAKENSEKTPGRIKMTRVRRYTFDDNTVVTGNIRLWKLN